MIGINSGADIIELDVRATEDNVVILSHDEFVDIPQKGRKLISDLPYNELKRLHPSIIRLDEVWDIIRNSNREVNLDLKDDTVTLPALKSVESGAMDDFVIFTGCPQQKASFITLQNRGLRVLLNSEEETFIQSGNQNYMNFVGKTYRDAVNSGCCGVNISYEACLDELMDYMAVRCIPVCVYTVDQADIMRKCIDMGAYSITTNRVRLLKGIK
jgi:glycerophosphoryl diester phosphodiesterase